MELGLFEVGDQSPEVLFDGLGGSQAIRWLEFGRGFSHLLYPFPHQLKRKNLVLDITGDGDSEGVRYFGDFSMKVLAALSVP